MYLIHRPRKKALLTSVREKPIEQFSWGKPANWGSFHVQAQKKNEFKNDLGSLSPQGVKALACCNSEVLEFHYTGGKRECLFT